MNENKDCSEKLTPHEVDVCSKPTTATSDVGTQNEDETRAEQGAKECFTVHNLEGATDEFGSIESTASLTVSEIASTGAGDCVGVGEARTVRLSEDANVQIMVVAEDGSLVPIADGSSVAILTETEVVESHEGVSVGVQANDYEIERRSGRLPARQRLIPHKFRDYKNPENEDEAGEDEDDKEYKPETDRQPARRQTATRGTGRRPGRPRKGEVVKKDTDDWLTSQESEQCERKVERSGKLPNRRSLIPQKFRDYESTEKAAKSEGTPNEDGEEKSQNDPENGENEGEHTYTQKRSGESVTGPDRKRSKRGRPMKSEVEGRPTPVKSFRCDVCNKSFSQKGNLKVHQRIHSEDKPFKCTYEGCTRSFRCNETLKRHNLAHMGIKLFKCDVCEQSFSSNIALKEHSARHTDTKSYKCDDCGRFFRQISCLRRHQVTHSSDMPFSCKVCSKKFSQMTYLRSHMRTHTGERPFACDKCTKAFSHLSDLNRHKIIHTGIKPYSCEYCSASFSDPSSRRRHEREHNGKKPYVCQICNDQFKRAGQMRAHLSKKHTELKDQIHKIVSSQNPLESFIITKPGADNTVQIVFQENAPPEIVQQLIVPQIAPSIVEVCSSALELHKAEEEFKQQQQQIQQQQQQPQQKQDGRLALVSHQGALELPASHMAPADGKHADQNSTTEMQTLINQSEPYQVMTSQSEGERVLSQSQQANLITSQSAVDQSEAEQQIIQVIEGTDVGQDVSQSYMAEQIHIDASDAQQVELVDFESGEPLQISYQIYSVEGTPDQANAGNPAYQTVSQDTHQEYHIVQSEPASQITETVQSEMVYESVEVEDIGMDQQLQTEQQHHQLTFTQQSPTMYQPKQQSDPDESAQIIQSQASHLTQDNQSQNSHDEQSQHALLSQPYDQSQNSQPPQQHDQTQASSAAPPGSSHDFVANPDFNSQEYYNWLSHFAELCRVLPMPLEVDVFQKISHVQKTLADILATPTGVLANRENFRILMNISRDLNDVINEHLTHVLKRLDNS